MQHYNGAWAFMRALGAMTIYEIPRGENVDVRWICGEFVHGDGLPTTIIETLVTEREAEITNRGAEFALGQVDIPALVRAALDAGWTQRHDTTTIRFLGRSFMAEITEGRVRFSRRH